MTSWNPRDAAHPERQTWDDYFLMLAGATAPDAASAERVAYPPGAFSLSLADVVSLLSYSDTSACSCLVVAR